MKLVPVYMLSVESGNHKLLWATPLIGRCHLSDVKKILEKANTRGDFNLDSQVHAAIIQESKENVGYILDVCGLPGLSGAAGKKIAGTCIGWVKVRRIEGWLCE